MTGIHTPVCRIAAIGLEDLARRVFAGVVAVSVALTTAIHVRNFDAVRTDADSVVLAAYESIRLLPGAAGNTVTYGHWAQSVDVAAHVAWPRRVFKPPGGMSPSDRRRALGEFSIDYVLVD